MNGEERNLRRREIEALESIAESLGKIVAPPKFSTGGVVGDFTTEIPLFGRESYIPTSRAHLSKEDFEMLNTRAAGPKPNIQTIVEKPSKKIEEQFAEKDSDLDVEPMTEDDE